MDIVELELKQLVPYDKNPRKNDTSVDKVAESIKQFGFKVPIVIDKDNVIVCGHTRYKASKKLKLKTVPCVIADDLTEEQIKAYRLADNKVSEFAEWDLDLLGEELADIIDIDMSDFGFDFDLENDSKLGKYDTDRNEKNLQERFGAPPFSILDARQGYWQDRKRQWKNIGISSGEGRSEELLGSGLNDLAKTKGADINGTSVFDPVLCELMYKWYCVENGKIFDPFSGGAVRGIVASYLGYRYIGIDLRQEQIEANCKQAYNLGLNISWYCDDSLNQDKYVENDSVDMVFSCPPYADLEIYSDDPRDISNMDYESFINIYRQIITKACNKLKDNRFAVWVVGEVRDKEGKYRCFIDDTRKIFLDAGMKFYNELILVEALGTAPLRGANIFQKYRKTVKTHQNVLVFYKGNIKEIKNNYKEVIIENLEE